MANGSSESDRPRSRGRLTEGPVRKHLVTMTVPMIWGLLSVISFNVVDTFFVGQLGTLELAAMSFTFPVVMIFFSISIGLSAGASSVVARAIGEGDQDQVRRLTTGSMLLSVVIVAICCAIGLATIDPLFTAMGATDVTLPLIRDYMEIWYLGFVFLVAPMVGNGCIRATGNAKFPAVVMVVTGVANAILDPILIFGLLGAPRLELQGAAIATVIARAASFIAAYYVLQHRERMLTLRLGTPAEIIASWRAVLHVGLPAAVTNVITPASMTVVTALVATHGAAAVAGFGVATRIESLSLVVMFAMSSVIGPIAGQNWGAGLLDRVRELVRTYVQYSLAFGAIATVVLAITGPWITPLFNADPDVTRIANLYLWTVPISFAGYALLQNTAALFNGIGKPYFGIALSATRMFLCYLPLAWFLGDWYGSAGIFVGAALANALTGLACVLLVAKRARLWVFA